MKSLDEAIQFVRQERVKKVQLSQWLSELMEVMPTRWRTKIIACLKDINDEVAFAGHVEPTLFRHYEIYKKIRWFTCDPREIYRQMNNSAPYWVKYKWYFTHLLLIFGRIYESEKTK